MTRRFATLRDVRRCTCHCSARTIHTLNEGLLNLSVGEGEVDLARHEIEVFARFEVRVRHKRLVIQELEGEGEIGWTTRVEW